MTMNEITKAPPEPLLTVAEVAARLRLSRLAVYRAIERGDLAAIRFGKSGHLRIRASVLARFLEEDQ